MTQSPGLSPRLTEERYGHRRRGDVLEQHLDEDDHGQDGGDGQAHLGRALGRHEEDEHAHAHEERDGEGEVEEVVERAPLHRHEEDDIEEGVLAAWEPLRVLLARHAEQVPLDVRVAVVQRPVGDAGVGHVQLQLGALVAPGAEQQLALLRRVQPCMHMHARKHSRTQGCLRFVIIIKLIWAILIDI